MSNGTTPAESSNAPAWQRRIGIAAAVFLGLVLLVAAWAKMLDPHAFTRQIEVEGLDFLLPAAWVMVIALAIEVALGAALLLGVRHTLVMLPTTLLVAFFVVLNVRTYWLEVNGLRADDVSCGCFGNLIERSPAEALWMDLLLLVPPLALAFLGRRGAGRLPVRRFAVAAVVTVGALVFTALAPELPLDDLATRLSPGVALTDICTGQGDERLCLATLLPAEQGRHLVVLADLEDEAFGAAVPGLNEYVFAGGDATLWLVTSATAEQEQAFYFSWGPAFELIEAPPGMLRPLYRRLPRTFELADGIVTQTWDGLGPLAPTDPDEG